MPLPKLFRSGNGASLVFRLRKDSMVPAVECVLAHGSHRRRASDPVLVSVTLVRDEATSREIDRVTGSTASRSPCASGRAVARGKDRCHAGGPVPDVVLEDA
jgi:hypothetical protein